MKAKRLTKFISCLLLLVVMGGELLFSAFSITASAVVTTYSDVMEDLKSDTSFSTSNYPVLSYDQYVAVNSDQDPDNDAQFVSVIHIAETDTDELFIYTYQPMNDVSDITATSVLMSVGEGSTNYQKYTLKCVSYDGVFKKYLVEDFTIPNNTYRFYNIVEIERPFDTLLDQKISNETITNFKTHTVGQTWCCYYYNDRLVYEMITLDVVEITPTLTDYLYYENGITWGSLVGVDSGCSAHYIAFNIDNYDVSKIIDATLEYKYRDFKTVHYSESGVIPFIGSLFGNNNDYTSTSYPNGADYTTVEKDLFDVDVVTREGRGLWAKTYTWNRIMTAAEFIKQFEDQGGTWGAAEKATLQASEFVFAFAETEIESATFTSSNPDNPLSTTYYTTVIEGTEVAQVDILRLHFESQGRTYNLGVVGDTTSGDNKPGGVADGLDFENEDWWLKIMMLLGAILLVVLFMFFSGPLTIFFKILWTGIKFFISLIWSIITIPFKLLGRLLRRK